MTVQIPPGFMQVFHPLFHSLGSRQWGVVIGYDLDSFTGTNQEAVTLADAYFRGRCVSLADSNLQFQAARAQIGNDGPPLTAISTLSNVSGARANESPPPNVATGVTKRTAFGGRAYRGRSFFPGFIAEGEVDELGVITTARINTLQTAMDGWLSDLNGGAPPSEPLPMVVLHGPPLYGGPIPPPTVVERLEVQRVVRTQRRRLRG